MKIYCIILLDYYKWDDYIYVYVWVSVVRFVVYTLLGLFGVNETTVGVEIGVGGEGVFIMGVGGVGEGDIGVVVRVDDGVVVVV